LPISSGLTYLFAGKTTRITILSEAKAGNLNKRGFIIRKLLISLHFHLRLEK
jgi:hypothetical protein